jgi:hypothetical protein
MGLFIPVQTTCGPFAGVDGSHLYWAVVRRSQNARMRSKSCPRTSSHKQRAVLNRTKSDADKGSREYKWRL